MWVKSLAAIIISILINLKSLSQRYDQEIDVVNPNYYMLSEAILRATNETRASYNLTPLTKHVILDKAAESHAVAMMNKNFFSHQNPHDHKNRRLIDRVENLEAGQIVFQYLSENIAQYDLLATKNEFCLKRQKNGMYLFYDCNTGKRIPVLTYKDFARWVVADWMKSTGHRQNILDPKVKFMGAFVSISKNNFYDKKIPFAKIVQDFGY